MKKIAEKIVSYFFSTPQDIDTSLIKARRAWFGKLTPFKNSFGIIELPHPAQMLTENQIENCYLLPIPTPN